MQEISFVCLENLDSLVSYVYYKKDYFGGIFRKCLKLYTYSVFINQITFSYYLNMIYLIADIRANALINKILNQLNTEYLTYNLFE